MEALESSNRSAGFRASDCCRFCRRHYASDRATGVHLMRKEREERLKRDRRHGLVDGSGLISKHKDDILFNDMCGGGGNTINGLKISD
jgi:hypothetical protein